MFFSVPVDPSCYVVDVCVYFGTLDTPHLSGIPSPSSETMDRGRIVYVLLSSPRSSGVMTLGSGDPSALGLLLVLELALLSLPSLSVAAVPPLADDSAGGVLGGEPSAGLLAESAGLSATLLADLDGDIHPTELQRRGAGKFFFLSTASTTRWNLMKRASALMRVESRSMLPDNSLTREC